MIAQLSGVNQDIWADQIASLLWSKDLWMYIENSFLWCWRYYSISFTSQNFSSERAHILAYCLYDPSNHKVIEVLNNEMLSLMKFLFTVHRDLLHHFLQMIRLKMILSMFQSIFLYMMLVQSGSATLSSADLCTFRWPACFSGSFSSTLWCYSYIDWADRMVMNFPEPSCKRLFLLAPLHLAASFSRTTCANFVPSSTHQLANIFSKPLPEATFTSLWIYAITSLFV